MLFLVEKLQILIVYVNELNLESSLIVEVGFHVAKHEDGRGKGHIHIVIEIKVSSKLAISKWYEVLGI